MTNSVFQGRSFLAEKDFTRAELEYLIGLSAHLKDLKNAIFNTTTLLARISLSYLKNIYSYSCSLYNCGYRPWCSPRIPRSK